MWQLWQICSFQNLVSSARKHLQLFRKKCLFLLMFVHQKCIPRVASLETDENTNERLDD